MTFVAPPPLEGVLVLDLSRVLAGPFATMMLADMGAIVIKVEEPERGDDTRGYGPPFVEGESTYYLSFNRNKWSIALDMRTPEGKEIIKKLAREADIVVENFRPGTADRMGLGYEALSKEKPDLIYVSVSGFGQSGPDRERPGYDLMAQGLGGLMSLTGAEDGVPSKVGVSQADLIAGMYAAQGALLALLSRQRTGRGQHVDVSLLDGQLSLLSFIASSYLNTGKEPLRHGNRHASIAPYQTYEAADGFFNVAVGNDRLFEQFAREVGRPELAQDERFATNAARVANVAALNCVLEPIFRARTVEEWTHTLDAARIPAGPILSVKQALEQPQAVAREMVVEVDHPTVGTVKMVGNPIKMSGTPARVALAPPLLGQHSEHVLSVLLKMKDDEIAALRERGVIKQWTPPTAHEAAEEETTSEAAAGEDAAPVFAALILADDADDDENLGDASLVTTEVPHVDAVVAAHDLTEGAATLAPSDDVAEAPLPTLEDVPTIAHDTEAAAEAEGAEKAHEASGDDDVAPHEGATAAETATTTAAPDTTTAERSTEAAEAEGGAPIGGIGAVPEGASIGGIGAVPEGASIGGIGLAASPYDGHEKADDAAHHTDGPSGHAALAHAQTAAETAEAHGEAAPQAVAAKPEASE